MNIDELVNSFGSVFSLLWSSKLMGMPVLFWFVIIGVFGIIGAFIQGKKGN